VQRVRVYGLLKMGEREHLEDLCHHGRLLMRPLSSFVARELGPERFDRNEGVSQHLQPKDITSLTIKTKDRTIILGRERFRGPLRISDGREAMFNIYCMTAITSANASAQFDVRLREFGNAIAVILNVEEFVARFLTAVTNKGTELRHGLVRYVDESRYSGEWGPFTKSMRFHHQREFRFALVPGTGQPLALQLGSLEDICVVGTDIAIPGGATLRV